MSKKIPMTIYCVAVLVFSGMMFDNAYGWIGCDCIAGATGCRTYPSCPPDYIGEIYFCYDEHTNDTCQGEPVWYDPDCVVKPKRVCKYIWQQGCIDGVLQGSPINTGLNCGPTVTQCSW